MVTLNTEIAISINKIDVSRGDSTGEASPPFEVVPLDDAWSGQEKL